MLSASIFARLRSSGSNRLSPAAVSQAGVHATTSVASRAMTGSQTSVASQPRGMLILCSPDTASKTTMIRSLAPTGTLPLTFGASGRMANVENPGLVERTPRYSSVSQLAAPDDHGWQREVCRTGLGSGCGESARPIRGPALLAAETGLSAGSRVLEEALLLAAAVLIRSSQSGPAQTSYTDVAPSFIIVPQHICNHRQSVRKL